MRGGDGKESRLLKSRMSRFCIQCGAHRCGLKVSGSATPEPPYASASSSIKKHLVAVSVIGSLKELNKTKHAKLSAYLTISAQ